VLHEVVLDGEGGGGGTGGDAELAKDVLEVAPDGVRTDHELRGDLPVRVALRDECEHLELARRQACTGRGGRLARKSVQPLEIGSRAEPGEGAARGLKLDVGAVAVAELSAGEREPDPGSRPLVRRRQLVPAKAALLECRQGRPRFGLGEEDRPESLCGDRVQQRGVEIRGESGEFACGTPPGGDGVPGQRDLDVGGQRKPAYNAYKLPLAQVSRSGARTVLWGQVRPRSGRQHYRLQQRRNGGWRWLGSTRRTGPRGFLRRTVHAGKGSQLRVWSPRDRVFSPPFTVR
jgi:hypothetical protein